MKQLVILTIFTICSCTKHETKVSIILENESINTEVIKSLDESEKALLSWYLFAYGNECNNNSLKIKCQILKDMNIENECDPNHLKRLLQWFSNDMLAVYKLNNCPNLPLKSGIQNSFDQIILRRKADSISIEYTIQGLNTLQEKSWNIAQTDSYLIRNKTFRKLDNE